MLFGDSNINLFNPRDIKTKKYRDFLRQCKMEQLISTSTRTTTSTSSLIDHIIVNRKKMFNVYGTVDPGLSDHCMVFTGRKHAKIRPKSTKIWTRSYRNYNKDCFSYDIAKIDWSELYTLENVNDAAVLFKSRIANVAERHAPHKWVTAREKSADWVSNEFIGLVDLKHHWCSKFNKHPSEYNKAKKVEAIRLVTRTCIALQKNYINDMLHNCRGKPDEIWKCFKKFWPLKSKSGYVNSINGQVTDSSIAEEFNTHFATVGEKLAEVFQDDVDRVVWPQYPPTFDFVLTDEFIVSHYLNGLSASKACGMDKITSKLLEDCGLTIIKPLTFLINLSLRTYTFPNDWKVSKVTSIYKDGPKDDPSNYRPISILRSVSKIFEKIIHEQIYAFLRSGGRLVESQSGFRKGHSTAMCLIDFLDRIYRGMDEGLWSGVLFLNQKKAFDTVDH